LIPSTFVAAANVFMEFLVLVQIKYQALGKLCSSAEETADPNKKVKRCVLTSALWESSDSDEELNLVCKKPKR